VHARGRFVPPSTMTPAGATSRQSRQQGLDSHTDSMRPGASSRQPSTTARQPFDDIFAEVEAEFAGRNLHRTASTPTRRRSRSEMAAALEDASIAERDGDARQTRTTAFMDGLLRGLDYDISPSLIGTDSLSSTGAEVASGSGASITSTPAGYAPQVSGAAPPRLSVDFMDTMGTGWDRLGLDGNHPVFGEEDHPNEDGVADTLFRALNDERRDVWATESMRSLGQNDVDGPFPQDVEGSSDENAMSSGRVPLPPFLLRSIHARRRNIFGIASQASRIRARCMPERAAAALHSSRATISVISTSTCLTRGYSRCPRASAKRARAELRMSHSMRRCASSCTVPIHLCLLRSGWLP
jgi:hypothetical protein